MNADTEIRARARDLERIDTHSHISGTLTDLREVAKGFEAFSTCQAQIDSRVTAEGCRELYGIDPGTYLRPDAPNDIFQRAEQLRSVGFRAALLSVLDEARISVQLAFCGLRPEESPLLNLPPRVRLIAYIDAAIAGNDYAFCPDGRQDDFCYYASLCEHFGTLKGLDDYLDALDETIDRWKALGVVGMKTALAYTLGLSFGDPSIRECRSAFLKKEDMAPGQVRAVQDFAFRHALFACKRNGLPVVVHTGFPIWGHADLSQTNPMLLHNLLIDPRYRDITFVLLHGGNPYVGETTYLAGMFPNVILDFTWIAWMTRTRFRMALGEWVEVVPHNRLCWGSDCGSLESIAGINRIVREEIANVLTDLVHRRIIDAGTALSFLQSTYVDTPKRVFSI